MKRLLLLLFISFECFAQISPGGARQIALSRSNVASNDDVFSLFNNPAGLSFINSREIGAYYSPAPFELKELANAYGAYCEPTEYGNFSAGFSIYGYELYKETQIALGYGRSISKNFFVGATTIYRNISIKNYGATGVFLLNLGAVAKINEKYGFGFSVENITRSTINDESNQIPTVFWLGTYGKFIKELTVNVALQKELEQNASVRFGAEYQLVDFIQLRFGVSNEPRTYSTGFGVVYDFLTVDYAYSSHPDLGSTHQFGVIVRLTKN
jgi:hypothetical protein